MTAWNCEDARQVGARWFYNWWFAPLVCAGIESVPMIRDVSMLGLAVGGNSQWVMGFNEPDRPDQANLAPAQAATLWRQIEMDYPSKRLVAPVPSQLAIGWIVLFRNDYIQQFGQLPRLDALAVHCYFTYAQDCIAQLEWYKAQARAWNVSEIWLTEFAFFACGRTLDATALEIKRLTDYLEHDPLFTRYAWFTNRTSPDEEWLNPSVPFECQASPLFAPTLTGVGSVYAR